MNPLGPIFISGMNGSGTTMLLDCLNGHSELYGFPSETRLMPYEILNEDRFGDLSNDDNFLKLWEHICGLLPFRNVNKRKPLQVPPNWTSVDRSAAAIFDHIFHSYAATEGKERWCEKSPRNILHITLLANSFYNSKFIHMIRDGRDCAASYHRRWKYQPERSMQRWKRIIQRGRQQGESLGDRYLEVFYEDITRNPTEQLMKISEFLGVQFEENMLEVSRVNQIRKRMTGNSEAKIGLNRRTYKAYFSPGKIKKLDQIAGKTLSELGYPSSATNKDQDLSKFKETIFKLKDMVWGVFFELKHKFNKNQTRRPWHMIFSRMHTALKQYAVNRE